MKPPLVEGDPVSGAPPALRDLQARFLEELRERMGDEELPASGAFLEPPVGSAVERWRIYREGYRLRLVEAIRNDYEAVARIVGPDPFRALIERYLEAHPPSAHDIGRAGDRLATFLASDPLTEKLPFLPDLARFEAALAASLVAADPAPIDRQALAALPPDDLLDLPLTLASGAQLLLSDWPVGDLWALRDRPDEEISLELEGRPARLVVHRDGLAVKWRELEDDEAVFLSGITATADGTTLADLLDSGRFGPPEEAAPHLVALFLRMVDSVIVRVPIVPVPIVPVPSTDKEKRQ